MFSHGHGAHNERRLYSTDRTWGLPRIQFLLCRHVSARTHSCKVGSVVTVHAGTTVTTLATRTEASAISFATMRSAAAACSLGRKGTRPYFEYRLNGGVPFLDIYFLVSTGTATTRLTEGLFGKTLTIQFQTS